MNILYCRKSTESEERQVLSLEAQKEALLEVLQREGLKVDKIYEESMSAKAPGRPKFNEMLELLKSEKNNTIFCWNINRLARNGVDGGSLTWYMDLGYISQIRTPDRKYENTPIDKFMMQMEFGVAKKTVDDLSVDVKRGNAKKLKNGGWPGPAPFGYLNDRLTHTIVPDPINGKYVQEMFNLFANGGYSLKQIVAHMRTYPIKRKLHTSLVYRIISNPFYMGLMIRNKELYQGAHEPLVSKTVFDACQALLNPNRERKQKHLFPLRGFMTCAKCGCALTATTKKGRFKYYYCTNGKKICDQHRNYIRAEKLNEQVADQLSALEFDEELIEIMYEAAKERKRANEGYKATALEQIKAQLASLSVKQDKLLDLFLSDSLSEDSYNAKNEVLRREQIGLQAQYEQLSKKESEGVSTLELTKKAFLTANYARKDFLSGDDVAKRKLAEILLWNFSVLDKKIVNFRLKQPFQIIADKEKTRPDGQIFSWQGR